MRNFILKQVRSSVMLALISPEEASIELQYLDRFFDLGLDYFHIRKPGWGEDELLDYLSKINVEIREKCVVHLRSDSKSCSNQTYRDFGVHLNCKFRQQKFPEARYYTSSVHQISELEDIPESVFSYTFVSPIFPSISKRGYLPTYNLEEISKLVETSKHKLCALGGIEPDNLSIVKDLGFEAIAVCGAIWKNVDPIGALSDIREIWQ